MGETARVWQRVSELFRGHAGARATRPAAPLAPVEPGSPAPAAGSAAPRALAERSAPWWRPAARREQVRVMGQRVTQLAEVLEDHFRQQDERATALAGSLDRVGQILEQLAVTQRAQSDYLRTIAEHTEAATRNSANLSQTVARLPDSLVAQAEAIRNVARQLEVAQESDTQLMHSLQQFGRVVDTLGASGTAQVEALQRLHQAQAQQHETFTHVVHDQSRRFLVVLIVLGVLALGAIVLAVVTLLVRN